MLPGCMSAWKKPSVNTWVKKISTPVRASVGMSMPAARMRSTCPTGMPYMRCMVNTVAAVYSQITSGTISMSPRPDSGPKLRRSWLQLEASRTRSSSSCRYLSNSATTSRGFRRRPSPSRSMMRATIFSRDRSFSMMLSMPGRST